MYPTSLHAHGKVSLTFIIPESHYSPIPSTVVKSWAPIRASTTSGRKVAVGGKPRNPRLATGD